MLGKHYLVNSTLSEGGLTIYRHYTIANCMRKEFYEELLRCLNADQNKTGDGFKKELLSQDI